MAEKSFEMECPVLQECSTKLKQSGTAQGGEVKPPTVSWYRNKAILGKDAGAFIDEDEVLDEEIRLLDWWTSRLIEVKPIRYLQSELRETELLQWMPAPEEDMGYFEEEAGLGRLLHSKLGETRNPTVMYCQGPA